MQKIHTNLGWGGGINLLSSGKGWCDGERGDKSLSTWIIHIPDQQGCDITHT